MAAISTLDTFTTVEDPITDWTKSAGVDDFAAAGGVAVPGDRTEDNAMSYSGAGAPATADHRIKVQVNFSTLGPFGLYARLGTAGDLTDDHIRVVFTSGTSVAPAFASPDTFQIIERISGVETAITPSNTASGVHAYYPAWNAATKVFSLRHLRLATGDWVELQVIRDQVIVKVTVSTISNLMVAHELCTVNQTGSIGIINYADGSADTTFDNVKGGEFTAIYCAETGDDTTGTGTFANPFRQPRKAIGAMAEGDILLVSGGGYNRIQHSGPETLPDGDPFLPTSHEDGLIVMSMAGEEMSLNWGGFNLRLDLDSVRYWTLYNVTYNNTSSEPDKICCKIGTQGAQQSLYTRMQGGKIHDSIGTGMLMTSVGATGDDEYLDIDLKGNGWGESPVGAHNIYAARANQKIWYCYSDGYHDGVNDTNSQGLNCYENSADPNSLDNTELRYCVTTRHTGLQTDWPAPSGSHGHGWSLARGANMKAVGVLSFANKRGAYVGYQASSVTVVDCGFSNNTDAGLILAPATTGVTDVEVRNTTFYNNPVCMQVGSASADAIDTLTKNCIFDTFTTQYDYAGSASTAVVETTNIVSSGGIVTFADAPNNDLQLGDAEVTAKTGGTTLVGFTMDALGYARPQGATWSRGLYEFPNPATDPLVNMSSSYSGAPNTDISLATVSVMGQGAEAIKAYLTITGTATLSCSDAVVTKEGGV